MVKLFLLCPVIFIAGMVHAQETGSVNRPPAAYSAVNAAQIPQIVMLPQAIDLALRNNPEIAAALHEVDALKGVRQQAGAIPNPELAYLIEDLRKETRTTTAQINQPIELGGKRSARIVAAERGSDVAYASLEAKKLDVRKQVVAAFYTVLSAQERYGLAQDSLHIADRALTIATKRVAAGKVSPLDETKARVARAAARVEVSQAASELVVARNRLAATWGAPQVAFDRVEGTIDILPSVPDQAALEARLKQSADITRAQSEIARRQALAGVERSKRIGDLTLTIGNKRDETLGRNQTVVGFSVPLPLFDRNQGNLKEALSRSDQAQDELHATEVRVHNELNQAYQRLLSARTEAELYQTEILPDATSAFNAATKGFEYGKFAFIDVLDAQRTLFQAKSQYLRALSEAHIAAAEIERLVGTVDTSLQVGNP
jgi:cobalt-zinc-cadmium efflux system outer membrane protein